MSKVFSTQSIPNYWEWSREMNGKNARKAMMVLGVVLLFAVGFMFLGMFIDIQIISEYNSTPISFTFTFLFAGALIGLFFAFRIVRHVNGVNNPQNKALALFEPV